MAQNYNDETVIGYTPKTMMLEASRCLLCLDAPCSKACPAGTDPGKFIRSLRFKNVKGAAETIRENNPLGSICARVCPTERYCELGCTRSGIDKPIDIARLQRYATDFEDATEMEILTKGKLNGKRIAIVGSGPSALAASATLLKLGYGVQIYEERSKAGGYLRYGIPEYRLPNYIVDKEIARISKLGLVIHTNTKIGKDITLEELKNEFDAVILAIGASAGKVLPMFNNNKYVETAINFLSRTKKGEGKIESLNNVLVIGGGDVAMDVVSTLKLLKTPFVTDVVYETFSEFKASKNELEMAQKLGVTIIDGYIPTEVKDNVVTFKHRHIDSTIKLAADKIILAVGQEVDATNLGIKINKNEAVADGYKTSDKKVFVTGDIANNDKTVVYAVRKGKEVAELIDTILGGK